MESRINLAVKCFKEGFNCSQAVFSTYSELFGVSKNIAYRVSSGFGAGIGRLQEVCGAVLGAVMLVGLKYGKIKSDDIEAHERTYREARKFCESFKNINGTINCRELLGCDISTPEGLKYAKENNLFSTKCARSVEDAAMIIEELLFG